VWLPARSGASPSPPAAAGFVVVQCIEVVAQAVRRAARDRFAVHETRAELHVARQALLDALHLAAVLTAPVGSTAEDAVRPFIAELERLDGERVALGAAGRERVAVERAEARVHETELGLTIGAEV